MLKTGHSSSEYFVFISSYGVVSETGHPPVLDAWTIKACIRMNATFISPFKKKRKPKFKSLNERDAREPSAKTRQDFHASHEPAPGIFFLSPPDPGTFQHHGASFSHPHTSPRGKSCLGSVWPT